jgi:hypothetical protein
MNAVSVSARQDRAERYLARVGPAVQGSNGDAHTYGACKVGIKFDLTEAEFWPVLSRWNQTCQPPWDERDLERKLSMTYRKSRVERGSALKEQRGQHDPTPPKRRRDPVYPPQADVLAFWERLRFAEEVPEVSTWLASRGITLSQLGAYPVLCVRALEAKAKIEPWPVWACYGQRVERLAATLVRVGVPGRAAAVRRAGRDTVAQGPPDPRRPAGGEVGPRGGVRRRAPDDDEPAGDPDAPP